MLYPIGNKYRGLTSLNGIWKFKQGENNVSLPMESDEVMAVPSSFNDIVVNQKQRDFIGDNWYECQIYLPQVAEYEELLIRFGSVTHTAKVYIEGELVGEHKGGFTPFEVVIPEQYYHQETARLTVVANNVLDYTTLPVGNYFEETDENGEVHKKVKENFDFFNYAGIHRSVYLYKVPKNRIRDITVVTDLSEDLNQAEIRVEVQVKGTAKQLNIILLDQEGQVIGVFNEDKIVVENPRLWEVLDAYLYAVKVELIENGQVIDTYTESFGVRKIDISNGQFLINNKPFYFKGFGKHEDTFINGRGLNEAANLMDLNLLKVLGANSFRTSHYPYSEEMMRLADRMGVVVIDEVPAVGLFQSFSAALDLMAEKEEPQNTWEVMQTKDAHEQVIDELIARDKNHPSVVMWVVANEPASHDLGARDYFAPLIKRMKEADPAHRPVTLVNIMTATPDKDEVMDLVDVVSLNRYYGWYVAHGDLSNGEKGLRRELEQWQNLYPKKPILITEYGADTLPGLHSMWDIPYTEEFQAAYYEMNHRVFDAIPNVVGEQVWNFADFETNVALFRIQGNHKGLFSRNRQPKQIVKEVQRRWSSIPHYNYKKK
ncbi:beta-glucuronidase [Streptococcus sp. NLN76]|uniref:beta-glucuronidase n=1 Tax=Streptococcus sp. NLN76 TaxID=2822800 RepID=UPI0018AC4F61|nr:beta-glucuronidase [Streptococcus sp. NLN76]MBF8969500.1 beta-glucuronidase [Streptococcus sp. NLN76]